MPLPHIADWNALDWILALILVLSTVRAMMRGLIQAIFGLAGLLLGFALATWNYTRAGDWILSHPITHRWLSSPASARIAGFLFIAAATAVVFSILGRSIRGLTHAIGLGPLDRLLGGAFGFARGLLTGVAIILTATALSPQAPWLAGSRLSGYFLSTAHALSFALPHELHLAGSVMKLRGDAAEKHL